MTLTSSVDFDGGPRQYDLTVRISDGVHNVDVLGTVVVLPVNEAAPVFTSSGEESMGGGRWRKDHDLTSNLEVMTLEVTDGDRTA